MWIPYVSIHTYMVGKGIYYKSVLQSGKHEEKDKKEHIVKHLHQEYVIWNPFWSTSSRNILNILCMYCDAICVFDMVFWIFHLWCWSKMVGISPRIRACKSDHFMSVALRVKKNIGVPCWLIIFVILAILLFQYEHVPQNEDPNRVTLSPIFSLGMSCN